MPRQYFVIIVDLDGDPGIRAIDTGGNMSVRKKPIADGPYVCGQASQYLVLFRSEY